MTKLLIFNFLEIYNFTSMEDKRKKCNSIVDLSKFISNKKDIE